MFTIVLPTLRDDIFSTRKCGVLWFLKKMNDAFLYLEAKVSPTFTHVFLAVFEL
jgi:hypothetical protein